MNGFELVNEKHTIKRRPYSDSFDIRRYMFNREITVDEFQGFLTERNLPQTPTKKAAAWYEEYVEISGSGREWEYKTVKPFLD